MLRIGLTGNAASGKSTVARLLAEHGMPVIDADQLAREAVAPGSPALAAIAARFGPTVLGPDGALDRAAMRRLVFADADARHALEAIVHPEVARLRAMRLDTLAHAGTPLVVLEIPLLFEAGLTGEVDVVVLVDAPADVRRRRLQETRGLSRAEADALMDAQAPPAAKRSRADYIIDNEGMPASLDARVRTLATELRRRAGLNGSAATP